MQRFVVCGEALIDLAPAAQASDNTFQSTWEALSAGGPMNSAVALAQLGSSVEFLGRLSTDRFGEQLQGHLRDAGVGLELAAVVDDPTSIAVISLDEQGKASYAFHFVNTANFGWTPAELPALSSQDWLHFGSLLSIVTPGDKIVLDWLEDCPAALSYDVNVRHSVIGDAQEYWRPVEPWFATVGRRGGLAKGSDDDVNFLAQAVAPGQPPLEVAKGWVEQFGLSMFVMTLGSEGAAAVLPGGEIVRVPGRWVDVVDTVGAGDTFMAGFLHAYVDQPEDVRSALQRGIAASAIVCTRQGAQPPTLAEGQSFLES